LKEKAIRREAMKTGDGSWVMGDRRDEDLFP
jgi:hypothetical protein